MAMDNLVVKMLQKNNNKTVIERRHERFAREYLIDYDTGRAYRAVFDENGDMKDEVAKSCAAKLFKSLIVQKIIDEEECKYIAKKQGEKEEVIEKMKRIYLYAMRDRDYHSAKGALDLLMKHYGMYSKHNQQKKYSPDDIAAIRLKLEANGVSFNDVNKPKELSDTIDVQDAEVVRVVPESDAEAVRVSNS